MKKLNVLMGINGLLNAAKSQDKSMINSCLDSCSGCVMVFVYGTLKRGFPNHGFIQDAQASGTFTTQTCFPLYLTGDRFSPCLLNEPGTGFQVEGEVYQLNPDQLCTIDKLERVHLSDGYFRTSVSARHVDSGKIHEVMIYMKNPDQIKAADIKAGPLKSYTSAHASLYRPRTYP